MGINQWGIGNNAGFAIPMESATPPLPETQELTLAWNPTTQLLAWVPCSISATTGNLAPAGNLNLAVGKVVNINAVQVVGARDTGWAAFTGTTNESAIYATGTVTLVQLAERVAAMQAALTTHGLIGA